MDKKGLVRQASTTKWVTPALEFKGSVGAILKEGGGKLSITGQDSGEMRCEKPHSSQCA
jgi:hypothetical protein